MVWVIMNERELNRVEVLAQVDNGRLTVWQGSAQQGRFWRDDA